MFTAACLAASILSPTFQQVEDTSNADASYSAQVVYAPGGPPEVYVYKSAGNQSNSSQFVNTFGKFVIGPNQDQGKATYYWRGRGPNPSNPSEQHVDTLTYQGRATVDDNRADTPPQVEGWLYEAQDTNNNKFWLVFGEDKIDMGGRERYPVYYTFNDPGPQQQQGNTPKFKRWLTMSGTSRL